MDNGEAAARQVQQRWHLTTVLVVAAVEAMVSVVDAEDSI
jgi:hypothetical protein